MQFQYDFLGGSVPQNLGILVCDSGCLDDLSWQQKLLILPPDPPPFFNTRPEPYVVDETNWLTTQDDEIITTQSGELITPTVPNPADAADISYLTATISAPGGSVAVAYLDLYDGDPATTGRSVLVDVTGSSTRTNIASSLTTTASIAQNLSDLEVAASSAGVVSITHIAIFDEATGGTLQMSGPVSVSPSVNTGNSLQFASLALTIDLSI